MNELDNVTYRLLHSQADTAYNLHCFGDHLAKREGFKSHSGTDAVRYYLMLTHGWLPSAVRSMSDDDLHFAIAEEMTGWIVPKARRP